MITKKIYDFDLNVITNSGQVFRMYNDNNKFTIYSKDNILVANKISKDTYEFDTTEEIFNDYYTKYFDLKNDYSKYRKICNKDDLYLKQCIQFSKGLRILNQDPFEMLISFIISQRKSIPAIRTCIEKICKCCGKLKKYKDYSYYAFPTAKEIYDNKQKIKDCGLGYRYEYVIEASKIICENKNFLGDLQKLNNDEMLEKLLKIKGVGIKVASCVMLFAYHRIDICPVDIWIKRVIDVEYNGNVPENYKKYLGIIQQYWFYYAKTTKELAKKI